MRLSHLSDVNITEDLWKPCCVSLQSNYNFINNCLNAKNKIKEYCEFGGRNNKGQIELGSMSCFIADCKSNDDIGNIFDAIKTEEGEPFDSKAIFGVKTADFIKQEELELCEDENVVVKAELDDYDDRFEETVGSLRSSEVLDVATNDDLERHGQIRNSVSENTEYRRESSTVDFDSKDNVSGQMSNESTPITQFKCSYCTFCTIHIVLLLQHMVGHMNASEITTYYCSLCSYRSKIIENLHKHLTLHQKRTTIHECDVCTYKTMYKKNLQQHTLTHKTRSEVTMYKCTLCSFQTKRKLSLNYHMLTHQNSSEVIVYKCEICGYHTKHKKNLGRHVLRHKNKKVRGVRVSEQTQAEHTTAHGGT